MRSEEQGIDRTLNALSDSDWTWWPFLRLRPAKDADLEWRTVLSISLGAGVLYGVPFAMVLFWIHRTTLVGVPIIVGIMIAGVLVSGCAVRGSWNRRARRLRRRSEA